jgi:AcrR family transcriptional regulator
MPQRPARPAGSRLDAVASDSPWRPPADRARDREVKREAVIQTAARAFRARGYHNTSLDDIAALLHVTKPTIYHYVQSKEQILFECFRTGLEDIRSGFAEVSDASRPGRERLLKVVRRYVGAITSDFGWCMVRAEDQDLSPGMSARIKALKSDIDQCIRQLIRAGIEDGSIRACDPKMTTFALAGALNWISHWHREDDALTPAEIADRFIDVFESGLLPAASVCSAVGTAPGVG